MYCIILVSWRRICPETKIKKRLENHFTLQKYETWYQGSNILRTCTVNKQKYYLIWKAETPNQSIASGLALKSMESSPEHILRSMTKTSFQAAFYIFEMTEKAVQEPVDPLATELKFKD